MTGKLLKKRIKGIAIYPLGMLVILSFDFQYGKPFIYSWKLAHKEWKEEYWLDTQGNS